MDETPSDIVRLGGNIELSGFKDIDGSSMVILRKIVGNYARRLADRSTDYQGVSVRAKSVHGSDNLFEISARYHDGGKVTNSQVTERNIFVAVDSALKKLDR